MDEDVEESESDNEAVEEEWFHYSQSKINVSHFRFRLIWIPNK